MVIRVVWQQITSLLCFAACLFWKVQLLQCLSSRYTCQHRAVKGDSHSLLHYGQTPKLWRRFDLFSKLSNQLHDHFPNSREECWGELTSEQMLGQDDYLWYRYWKLFEGIPQFFLTTVSLLWLLKVPNQSRSPSKGFSLQIVTFLTRISRAQDSFEERLKYCRCLP